MPFLRIYPLWAIVSFLKKGGRNTQPILTFLCHLSVERLILKLWLITFNLMQRNQNWVSQGYIRSKINLNLNIRGCQMLVGTGFIFDSTPKSPQLSSSSSSSSSLSLSYSSSSSSSIYEVARCWLEQISYLIQPQNPHNSIPPQFPEYSEQLEIGLRRHQFAQSKR